MAKRFLSPPDIHGFRNAVWEIVRKIPAGSVATYGQIAKMIPIPHGISHQEYTAFASRWVGGAMASCPTDIPWHRVINSQGKISLTGAAKNTQKERLEAEGIVFDERERIDLKRFGWDGLG